MPLNGIQSNLVKDMSFSWMSLRTFYSCFIALNFGIFMGFTIAWAFRGTLNFDTIGEILYMVLQFRKYICF